MCFVMGIGAGGMLPIAFALIAETIPARHRGWLIVLIGGDIAGAYVITSWLAGSLTPEYSWRILWLVGMPTGLLLILLNRWIPESPRYLLATGRPAEAEAIMRRYGARSSRCPPPSPSPEAPARASAGCCAAAVRWAPRVARARARGRGRAGDLRVPVLGADEPAAPRAHRGSSDYVLRDSALLGLPLTVVVALLYGFWSSRWTVILLSALTALAVCVFACRRRLPGRTTGVLLSVLLVVPLSGISSVAAVVAGYAPRSIRP